MGKVWTSLQTMKMYLYLGWFFFIFRIECFNRLTSVCVFVNVGDVVSLSEFSLHRIELSETMHIKKNSHRVYR